MVWLLAAEDGADPPRATDDVDLVVDIRAEPAGIRDLFHRLEDNSFDLEGISPDSVGHRYVRATAQGPGSIMFDVLAPDKVVLGLIASQLKALARLKRRPSRP
jgi:hypothetical protein